MVLVTCVCACRQDPGEREHGALSPEAILFGGETCEKDSDCASQRCSLGICLGFLMNSLEVARLAQMPLIERAAADPATRDRMLDLLSQVLAEGDPFLRARAAQALSAFPAAQARPVLERYLDDPEEPVRFQVARARARLGDERGVEALRGFLQHESPAVCALARFVLEHELPVQGVRTR